MNRTEFLLIRPLERLKNIKGIALPKRPPFKIYTSHIDPSDLLHYYARRERAAD